MITLKITCDAADARNFLVQVEGKLKDRRGLNAALGSRLADELQEHFRQRNAEPNKMGADKTNFWQQVADATQLVKASVTETGATVAIAESRFRIHLYGGTIKAVRGKFLTIPLVKEARGLKGPRDYENKSGHKLFRLPGTRVLVERGGLGDRSILTTAKATVRSKDGTYRKINVRGKSQIRSIFALKESVTIRLDPRALPPAAELLAALNDESVNWLKQNLSPGKSS